jgi:hypothetical protein
MSYSKTGKSDMEKYKAALQRIIDSFASDEKLSEFERGQIDALRWAMDVLEMTTKE